MQDQMRACPHCGAQTSANAQFCKTCGKSVAAEPTNMPREATAPIERKCSACGEALSETAQFCETCGKSVAPIAQPANTIPKAAPAVSADRPAAPVVAPTTHASRSTNLGLFVSLAIVGVLIIIGCLAVAVLGFWFMQSKPTVTSQLPAGTPQLVVVPTYIVPTNIAPTNVPTSPAATIRPPTSAPLATNTPSLPVGVLFLDDFASQDVSKRNGWYFGSDDTVDEKWSANQLLISIKTKNRSAVNLTAGQYQDFAVETEAQLIEGDSASYGLVFRSTESGGKATYYYFNVTADGGYSVWRFVNGNSIEPALIPIQTSQFINHGKAKNIVGVMAKGNTLSFYINRVRVQTVTDDTIQSKGQVGVEVAGFSEHATVAFSRFTVYTPDKAQAEWCPPPTTALPVGVLFNEDFSSARVAACNGWW